MDNEVYLAENLVGYKIGVPDFRVYVEQDFRISSDMQIRVLGVGRKNNQSHVLNRFARRVVLLYGDYMHSISPPLDIDAVHRILDGLQRQSHQILYLLKRVPFDFERVDALLVL